MLDLLCVCCFLVFALYDLILLIYFALKVSLWKIIVSFEIVHCLIYINSNFLKIIYIFF